MIDERRFLRAFHPEFDDIPESMIPWPYRPSDAALPMFCPKCGRKPIHYWWGGDGANAGYHELACAGPLRRIMVYVPGLMFWGLRHWQLAIGKDDRPVKRGWRFDPETGEPMDGRR